MLAGLPLGSVVGVHVGPDEPFDPVLVELVEGVKIVPRCQRDCRGHIGVGRQYDLRRPLCDVTKLAKSSAQPSAQS